MDYQSRYNAIRGDMADEESLLKWQADEGFQDWLRNGPLTIDRHTITRTGHRQATVIEPDGTVFANILFGPTCPDTLPDMLAWHRKGKPKPDVYEPTDRERIDALTRRVEILEKWMAEGRDVQIPAFLKAAPPHEIADTLEEYGLKSADSYERVNETLVQALAKAKGSAELARGYGGAVDGKSVVEWERKAQSINESIRWNSGRKVETI